jgi:hypothetical protein
MSESNREALLLSSEGNEPEKMELMLRLARELGMTVSSVALPPRPQVGRGRDVLIHQDRVRVVTDDPTIRRPISTTDLHKWAAQHPLEGASKPVTAAKQTLQKTWRFFLDEWVSIEKLKNEKPQEVSTTYAEQLPRFSRAVYSKRTLVFGKGDDETRTTTIYEADARVSDGLDIDQAARWLIVEAGNIETELARSSVQEVRREFNTPSGNWRGPMMMCDFMSDQYLEDMSKPADINVPSLISARTTYATMLQSGLNKT